MKASTKRTLKKLFLNIAAVLFAVIFTGNIIAGENAGQINQALGTKTSETISTLPEGQVEGYSRYFESKFSSIAELKAAGLAKAQEVEEEGIVLLKNEGGALPLAAGARVSLFGVTSIDPVYGGTGSGAVETSSADDYVAAFAKAGLTVSNNELLDWYREEKADENLGRTNYTIGESKWSKAKKYLGDDNEQIADTAAIYIIGRVGGEGADMTEGARKDDAADDGTDYLKLNDQEDGMLKGLKGLKDKGEIASITVIINSANPISTAFLYDEEYDVDAALWVGSLGQTGIYAVGDVLTGKVNPSGSLPDTWWMDNMQNPVMNNFNAYTYANADQFNFKAFSAFGKYVVPTLIESKFSEDPLIDNILVVGENQKFAAALIVPNFSDLRDWCHKHEIDYTTNEEMINHPKVQALFKKIVDKYNRFFGDTEKVKSFSLVGYEWSIQTGELTPTLKLKRNKLIEKYSEQIEQLFNK